MTKFHVQVTRGNIRWVLECIEADGALSEVDDLADAEVYQKEAISYITGIPEDEIEVELLTPFLAWDSKRQEAYDPTQELVDANNF